MKDKDFVIDDTENVIVSVMNTITEIKKTNIKNSSKPKVKRIDKKHYVDTETGEVKEYNGYYDPNGDKSRKNNPQSLSNTRRLSKQIIITNFIDKEHTQYFTLKYYDKEFRLDKSKKDIKNFIRSIRKKFKTEGYKINYVRLNQTHFDGSFHFHILLYWNQEYPDYSVDIIKDLWKYGECYFKPIKHNEDILFIAAYFVDGLTAEQGEKRKSDIAKSNDEKGAIKQARLEDIPAYSRIISHSNEMKKAVISTMSYKDASEMIKSGKMIDSGIFEKKYKNGVYIKQLYEYYSV
ncbi:MAG: hypothetical protein ACI4F5_04605 [Acutalibacteraceae bacterium]